MKSFQVLSYLVGSFRLKYELKLDLESIRASISVQNARFWGTVN